MVKYRNNFYTEYYLPLLLHTQTDICDVTDKDYDEQLETYDFLVNNYGEELDYERISIPDEVLIEDIINELVNNYHDEVTEYLIDNYSDYISEKLGFDIDDYLYGDDIDDDEYSERYDEITNKITDEMLYSILNELDDEVINIMEEIDDERLFEIRSNYIDRALMWNTVFEPEIFDIDTAIEVGLIPFTIYDPRNGCSLDLVSIAGAGMDLSPKLDAYQVLVSGTIPKNSTLFSQPEYFKYVVGENVFNKVREILKK